MIFLKFKDSYLKVFGIIKLKNYSRYDYTDVEVKVDISKVTKKYGKIEFSLIDEFNNIINFEYFNKHPTNFENWEGKYIIVKVNKITAKETNVIYLTERVSNKVEKFLEYGNRNYKRKLFLGSKIEIIEKIPWNIGHNQSLVRLNDYLYIATIDLEEKAAYVYKLNIKNYKTEDYVRIKFGNRYHISGMAEDKKYNYIYLAVAEYKPKVKNSTIIIKLNPKDLNYEKVFEVEDHIGSVCANKKYLYLFSWDAEVLYIYDFQGKLIKKVRKRGWGKIQDCDYSYGKIYGTSQYRNRIDVIETKNFNVINRIYTPKGLTNEGFDIDYKNPQIFWFLPDDGYIYKTKYISNSGYVITIKPKENSRLNIDFKDVKLLIKFNNDIYFKYIENNKVIDEFKIEKRKIVNILLKMNRVVIYNKDLKFNYEFLYLKNREGYIEIDNANYLIRKYAKKIKCTTYVL